MITEHPLVSVLIPSFNAGSYLIEAVNSILNQSYSNLEVIVIDDGSTDASIDTIINIRDKRLKIITQENSGKSAALNNAIKIATGEYIAIQDADDLSYPTRIEEMVNVMVNNHDIGMLFSGHDIIINNRRIAPINFPLDANESKKCIDSFQMPGHDPTLMVKTTLAKEYLFDPKFSIGQGLDFILRIGEKHPTMSIGTPLYSYRITKSSATKSNLTRRIRFVRQVLRDAYSRRNTEVPKYLLAENDGSATDNFSTKEYDNNLAAHFIESVLSLKRLGLRQEAIKIGIFCAKLGPSDFHHYKALIYSLTPLWMTSIFRGLKNKIMGN